MDWNVSITGDKKLDKSLKDLEPKFRKKVANQAMRKGSKVVQKTAKRFAPVGETGRLKKNIKVRSSKRSRRTFGIDVRVGDKDFQGDTFYGAMVEFGTKKQEGQHFLEQAYDTDGKRVRDLVIKEMWNGIEKLAKQGAK